MRPVVAFVHLGGNPSPTLLSMANAVKTRVNEVRVFLVTDFPNNWDEFPGEIVEYDPAQRSSFILKFIKKYPELKSMAGGYWLYALERLFALKSIYSILPSDSHFVHLESDVLSLLNEADFELMAKKVQRVACPRFSDERGVASIFFVPSQREFDKAIESFIQILNGPSSPTNDMDLLGICLNNNIIDELPSLPKDAWENSQGERLVFDGAAYGQYLFGQDPFHTDGKRISGFQNPDFGINLQQAKWSIVEPHEGGASHLLFSFKENEYRVLNLHIHSKLSLTSPSFNSRRWVVAIHEANGEIERLSDPYEPNHIHTLKVSILNRIRIASRKGLVRTLYYAVVRRIQLLCAKIRSM